MENKLSGRDVGLDIQKVKSDENKSKQDKFPHLHIQSPTYLTRRPRLGHV